MYKKILAISFVGILAFIAVVVLSTSHRVLAYQGENENGSQMMGQSVSGMMSQISQGSDNEGMHIGNADESVTIRPNGDFKVTGATVNSVDTSSNSVNASLYGFSRTVSLSGATIMGGGKTISISDIQAGDKLAASGNFNETTHALVISQVNDVSYGTRHTADIQGQINQLLQLVHQLQAQLEGLLGH